ncbi:CPBP family intramembrane glutamic endopeptidase [Murimonas intestini]|uniref:CPBP family intramembrane glutamic endopeptidase n=1 Tax=Murimonas intestini TaxID=1337051 RepID=UPI00165280BE|nr:type II CAAX endopeptidase family protein [Murimonas intestini]
MVKNRTKAGGWLFLVEVLWVMAVIFGISPYLPEMNMLENTIFSEVVFALPPLIYIVLTKVKVKEWIPHNRLNLSTALMVVLFTALLMPVVSWLNMFSMIFAKNYVNDTVGVLTDMPLWLGLLSMAVIPAVFEELVYRGIYYRTFRGKGFLQAALACGIAFGISHLNFNQFSYALLLGVVFCALMEATGSIYATILSHFIINGWSVVANKILPPLIEALQDMQAAMGQPVTTVTDVFTQTELFNTLRGYTVVAAVSGCLAFGVLVWIMKHCRRTDNMRQIMQDKDTDEGGRTFLSVPFIAGAVLGFIYMAAREIYF